MPASNNPRSANKTRSPVQAQKLQAVTPEERDSWSDSESGGGSSESSDATLSDPQPEELDEGWPYTFRPGEKVWIRTVGGNWYPGRVSGQTTRKGQTRQKEGLFYPVIFNEKLRKYFAPLNGEIKPDTPHVRKLLKAAGWV